MFADPKANLTQLGLSPGMQVADLGAGSGFYTLAAAHFVGGGGRVFAVDVQKDLLDRVKNAAHHDGLHNVEVVWGDIEHRGGTRLRDSSIDRVILSDTLSQAGDRNALAAEVARLMKPNGKLLCIDWSGESGATGVGVAQIVTKPDAKLLFEGNGFVLEREFSAGSHHYGLIFKKK